VELLRGLFYYAAFETIDRNKDWKNDRRYSFKDINIVSNSFLVNENVATMLVNKSDFEKDEKKRMKTCAGGEHFQQGIGYAG